MAGMMLASPLQVEKLAANSCPLPLSARPPPEHVAGPASASMIYPEKRPVTGLTSAPSLITASS